MIHLLEPLVPRSFAVRRGEAQCPFLITLAPGYGSVENLAWAMFPERNRSVGTPKNPSFGGRVATGDAGAGAAWLLDGDTTHSGACFFFDLRFALRAAAPEGKRKTIFHGTFQVLIGFRVVRIALAESQRLVMQRLLNFREQALGGRGQISELGADLPLLAWPVAASQHGSLFGDVFRPQFHAQGNAAHFPIVEFPAGALAFALIERDANVSFCQLRLQFARRFKDGCLLLIRLENWDNHGLVRRELGRQYQPLVVAVHHDDRSNDARGKTPGRGPAMLQLAVLVEVFDLECLGEILS